MMGLLLLEHIHKLSEEEVIERWVENPYWQYFCGYDHFQWTPPIHPSSLTRWCNRLWRCCVIDFFKTYDPFQREGVMLFVAGLVD